MKLYKNKQWLKEQYIDKELSTTQIGKICGIAARNILYWLNKFNIKVRTKSEALSGNKNPNFGKTLSKEIRIKISKSSKGKTHTKETKEKIRNGLLGKEKSTEHKIKLSNIAKKRFANKENHPMFGKTNKWGKHTEEAKKKISEAHKGEKNFFFGKPSYMRNKVGNLHPCWVEPKKRKANLYSQIRTSFLGIKWKISVFKRDNHTCVICNKKQSSKDKIEADHIKPLSLIVYENNISSVEEANNCKELWDLSNGRTLCVECHKKTKTYSKQLKKLIKIYYEISLSK